MKSSLEFAMEAIKFITGWWYTYPSETYEFVSWDDNIPNINGKIKVMFQTTNQWLLTIINRH